MDKKEEAEMMKLLHRLYVESVMEEILQLAKEKGIKIKK